jgi:hypothetical protein
MANRPRGRAIEDHRKIRPDRLAEAAAAAALLRTDGKHVSRRTLRTAGVHGSNADLGTLARIAKSQR